MAVKRAFSAAQDTTNQARFDVRYGTDSRYGFNAMFKTGRAVGPVVHYLSSIRDYTGSIDLKPQPLKATPPRFVCVSPDTRRIYTNIGLDYDPWLRCQNPVPGGPPRNAFYADGTAYIFICPRFLTQPLEPLPSVDSCPTVINNKYVGDSKNFHKNYQVYTILYELIRFYLGVSALNPNSDPKEVFDWNVCLRYGPDVSWRNPTNLLLYIACESVVQILVQKHPLTNLQCRSCGSTMQTPSDTSAARTKLRYAAALFAQFMRMQ